MAATASKGRTAKPLADMTPPMRGAAPPRGAVCGAARAAKNLAFYVAIDHLPLGTAVAIEFLGPVAVAAVTGSGWRERGAIAVAAAGGVLLAGVTVGSDLPHDDAVLGLAAIAVAAACWAACIARGLSRLHI